ncbi:hypothetical protein M407DRAFT_27764 [Tulasnella calospora MUT 4182]|uniref:Uncharacterized protein n=1 Tax=Tulasnella calospora MUT 4182 TaxID=1051891 RepID=A0A0C3QDB3_9AGAM|nr:hypothetical protein M407DRAFT_27764 [Tulasnella calospora MUT 4182]
MLQSALRTLATRSHASVAASSRALLRPRAPRASPIQRFSSAAYGARGANPLAPEEGEEDEMDEHEEQANNDTILLQAEEQEMPKARGDHLPVNWSLYQSILGQPVINTYHALRTVGYDAPWELFVRYCDSSNGKFRAVLKAMDAKSEDNFRARIKAAFKGSEAMYMNDCWKVLMQKRKPEQGVELEEADKPSIEGFTGGTWKEWNTLRLKGRDAKLQVKETRKRVTPGQTEATDKSFSSLLPPTPGEKNRWFIIQRPSGAPKSSQSPAQDQTGAEEPDADANALEDAPGAPTSQKWNKIHLHRSVRLPSLPPGTSIGSSRIYFYGLDWSDESIDKKEVAIMFDKDTQTMQLIERKPGAEDGEWKLAAPPVSIENLAGLQNMDAIMELAKDQGLLDVERFEKAGLHKKLREGVDTLDLATNLSRGLKLKTYPIQSSQRNNAELRFRLFLADPAVNGEEEGKSLPQHTHTTLFPSHLPDVYAARLATLVRKNKLLEAILERKDPNDPPEMKEFTEDGALEVLPYISAVGATPVEQGWEVDVSTPNRDTNPPTVTPAFPNSSAQPSSSPSSDSTSSPASKPGEALILRSASPETLRFWGWGLRQDLSFLPRNTSTWKGGWYSAWTGEQVRERMPVLWAWAKKRGHWKEISEKK